MAQFKLCIGAKTGKCYQKEVQDAEAADFLGKNVGENIAGDAFGMSGYEFQFTVGSDYCGFPMRRDVGGTGRKRILAVEGVGLKRKGKGIRQRKTVCGNTIHARISQVNLKVTKKAKQEVWELLSKAANIL